MMALASDPICQPIQDKEQPRPLIAVVDDSALMRKLIGYSLQRAGFRVQDFADGVELLRAMREPEAQVPALVLLDIGLPRMNGYQVARALKGQERTASSALVMVSRRTGVLDRLKGRLVGACGWLSKPFTTQELLAVVRAALLDGQPQQAILPLSQPSDPLAPPPQYSGERQG
jgi:twitching motility two-component system response regulator PilG